ncbi:MAG: prolyl oligopeptidase family serine peptidase [Bacteroidales bacterium]|nr:prolyl oligopeptidase family serine peptidase [Bacteroidales bacterium]
MTSTRQMATMLAIATLFLAPQAAKAQKKALDHDVYDSWQRVDAPKLSTDGRVLTYSVLPQQGDGTFFIKKEFVSKKGKVETKEIGIPRGYNAVLDPECRWVYLRIKPEYAKTRQEKIDKKKETTKDTMAVVDLKDLSIRKYGIVESFTNGYDAMPFVAFKSSWKVYKDSTDKKGTAKSGIILLNPATDRKDTLMNVGSFGFNTRGDILLFTTTKDAKDSLTCNSAAVMRLAQGDAKYICDTLARGAEAYSKPVFNDTQDMLAFKATTKKNKTGGKEHSLFLTRIGWPAKAGGEVTFDTKEIIPEGTIVEGTDGWTVTEHSSFYFTPDSRKIIISIAPVRPQKDSSIVDFETAQLDIWNWDAPYTPPQQRLNNKQKVEKTYTAIIDLAEPGKIVPLAKSFFESISLLNGGASDWAVCRNSEKYVRESFWVDENLIDISLVNMHDGSRKEVAERLNYGRFGISSTGRYLIWFDNADHCWYTYDTQTGNKVNISAQAGVPFHDELDDHPTNSPEAHERQPRWLAGDQAVLIIDRYDIWKFAPDGSSAVNLTGGVGRSTRNRFVMIDPEPDRRTACQRSAGVVKAYDPKSDMMFTVLGEDNARNGYGKINLAKPAKTLRYFTDTVTFSNIQKAMDSGRYAFQKGNFRNCYDLYTTDDFFATCDKVTAINPQMSEYRWGHVEQFHWNAYDGTPLTGNVYIPDDIKPGEKLPVMCYFYEKNSHLLYAFHTPAPSRSIINISFFTSRGYIVFVPDIVYKDGHPGESAYNCICSGAEALCKAYPFADKDRMAIQGQSWGGYQTAYLVTRTDMFAAGGAGAPVSNMTSAYGGIRWGSGMTRAGQYEHGQSRIGKTLWEEGALDLYIENSPVFKADKVNTPLLIMHNDADGAVPWYQGIEYFSALRRLGKPCWMLQYNGEEHNLVQRRNCKDLSIRLSQFFDHYLKGEPMPAWMKSGVPYDRKGEYFGYEMAE